MTFLARLLLTLFGMVFVALFAIGVMCWLAMYVVFASVRWLFTGQKPQVLLMWQQIQAMRKGLQTGPASSWSRWSRNSDGQWHKDSSSGVIEDVVVREVRENRFLPKD